MLWRQVLSHSPTYEALLKQGWNVTSELEREKHKLRKLSPGERVSFLQRLIEGRDRYREKNKLPKLSPDERVSLRQRMEMFFNFPGAAWISLGWWASPGPLTVPDLSRGFRSRVSTPLLRDPVKARQPSNEGQTVSRLSPRKNHFPTQFQTEATNKRQEPGLSRTLTIDWKRREKLHAPGRSMDVPISASHDLKPASIGAVKPRATWPSRFLRGDVDQDGQVSIRDAEVLLKWIYAIGPEPPCLESADVNNDGEVRPGDALQIINYTTHGLTPPAGPFPVCDEDPDKFGDGKGLGCDSYDACSEEVEEEEKEKEEEDAEARGAPTLTSSSSTTTFTERPNDEEEDSSQIPPEGDS